MAGIVFPVRGNHDGGNSAGWQQYFSLRERADALGMTNFASLDEDLTYSFDYANAHLIGLDVPGNIDVISGRQVAFVDQALAAAEARGLDHAFLFFHGPVYPTALHASCEERVCPLTPRSGADRRAQPPPQRGGDLQRARHLQLTCTWTRAAFRRLPTPSKSLSAVRQAQSSIRVSIRRGGLLRTVQRVCRGAGGRKNYSVSYYRLGQDEPVVIYAFTNEID